MGKKRTPKAETRRMAMARMDILWKHASEIAKRRPDLARRWVHNTRKIAQKARIKVPRSIGRKICKACGTVLIPGHNCRIRIRHNRSKHVTVTCGNCGAIRRFYV